MRKFIAWFLTAASMLFIVAVTTGQAHAGCTKASWYGRTGNPTANGEAYTGRGMTAAHRTLPFGTRVLVTNLQNGKSVVLRINDRGPFIAGRTIDVSSAAADALRMKANGHVCVSVSTIARK